MQDHEIIALYNKRDQDAIVQTDRKYGAYCFAVANRILANEQDSEECVNDTYLRTWNAIPPQCPTSLKLFLAKITRYLSFDRYKQRKRMGYGAEITLTLDELDEVAADLADPADALAEQAFAQAFNQFLHTLPERDCNVFVSRYFHVRSTEEIAHLYGLSQVNVRKILSRTRSKLKEYLESEGYTV